MNFRQLAKAGLVAALTLITSTSFAQYPRGFDITSFKVGGSGCPKNSVEPILTNSRPGGPNDYFQVTFDNFQASAGYDKDGDKIPSSEGRKTCNMTIKAEADQKFQMAFETVEVSAYRSISPKGNGKLFTNYQFPFVGGKKRTFKFKKGSEGDINIRENISRIYSECDDEILFNTNLGLIVRDKSKDEKSQITVDVASGLVKYGYRLVFRLCK